MKRWIVLAVLVIAVIWLLVDHFSSGGDSMEFAVEAPVTKTIEVTDVIEYVTAGATTYRVWTTREVLPGGLSAAMSPVLVNWGRSDFSPEGQITLRNVNHGGNPVSGITVLRTATVYPDKVIGAELVMVPLGGPKAVSHGQIRFKFEDGGAQFMDGIDGAVGAPDALDDLVLSWEAWRPPGVDFDVIQGMDPKVFQLTMRGYSGTQRFIEDALMGRDWYVYTLRLPGGRAGLAELLRVTLAMGDGAARYVVSEFLEKAESEWAASGPSTLTQGGDAMEKWRAIKDRIGEARTGGDDRIDMTGRSGYQTMLRSCATMALYAVNVTTARLIEAGYPHEGMRPTQQNPEIEGEPEWMVELAGANIAELFVRAPSTIAFIFSNPTSIPGRIPKELGDAGLLVKRDGKLEKRHFSIKDVTPWGPREHLLIR